MLPSVWQGLALKESVKSITCRFPDARAPRPILTLPPIPNLTYLHITDIDPLCYPDDISELLVGSKKLQHLKLHWSPRMRDEKEPSVSVYSYFGKLLAANHRMPLKSISLQNLYAQYDKLIRQIVDPGTIESFSFISTVGGDPSDPSTAFIDYSWRTSPPVLSPLKKLNMLRGDTINGSLVSAIAKIRGLKYYYLMTGRPLRERPSSNFDLHSVGDTPNQNASSRSLSAHTPPYSPSTMTPHSPTSSSSFFHPSPAGLPKALAPPASPSNHHHHHPSSLTPSHQQHPYTPSPSTFTNHPHPASGPREPIDELGRAYLDVIRTNHGPTLRHLLLRPEWRLSTADAALLAQACPVLEQLGLGLDTSLAGAVGALLGVVARHLPRLRALRILDPVPDTLNRAAGGSIRGSVVAEGAGGEDVTRAVLESGDAATEAEIERVLEGTGSELQWVGLGECLFEVKEVVVVVASGGEGAADGQGGSREGLRRTRREKVARRVPLESARDVEVWAMDRKEI